MMNETEIKTLEDKFYSQEFYLSYSGLNKLMYSPRLFYQWYVLQEKEEKLDSYLLEGKVIHCLLLDNGSFDSQFIVSPSKLPTDNTKIVIDKLFNYYLNYQPIVKDDGSVAVLPPYLDDHPEKIIEILKEINLHQSLKTDEQRLAKIITEETKSYFQFLIQKGKKDLIDEETYKKCREAVDILKNNKAVNKLMCIEKSDFELQEVYNEYYIQVKEDVYPFGMKGILDNVVIDYTTKVLYINDLKTSSKSVSDFKESIEYYNYGLQAAIYKKLAIKKFNIDESFKVLFSFVVIDKYQQVAIFEVSDATMLQWSIKLDDALAQANWHYLNKDFSLPYEFVNGKIII